VWEEGAKILEQEETGHLASASLVAARVRGADPKVLAAVIRGAVPMWPAELGKSDAANQKVTRLPAEIPTARSTDCEGDHLWTLYQPTFHKAVLAFLQEQWHPPVV
jgi:hypothetical protein